MSLSVTTQGCDGFRYRVTFDPKTFTVAFERRNENIPWITLSVLPEHVWTGGGLPMLDWHHREEESRVVNHDLAELLSEEVLALTCA